MSLSRGKNPAPLAPFTASGDWLEVFEAQCTKALQKKAARCAARCARKLSRVGGVVDDYYLGELVQDVLGDTVLGTLGWDPGSESLEDHVLDAIATRVHNDVVRATKFPHVSLDTDDPETSLATLAAVDASLRAERQASPDTVRLAEDSFNELWELAAGDPDVRRFLEASLDGATCRDDVKAMTGMSEPDHHAARNRLDRLIGRLSRNVQPSRRRSPKVPEAIAPRCPAAITPIPDQRSSRPPTRADAEQARETDAPVTAPTRCVLCEHRRS
jgi:hypothetical protein